MSFDIKTLAYFEVFGVEVWLTETIRNTWIVMGALILLAVLARIKLRSFTDTPKGVQNVIEMAVEMFDGFVKGAAGERLAFLGGWFFTVFSFILLSNFCGIFSLRPPTADWTTTITFALATFVLIQIMGVKMLGTKYLKGFLEPIFIFLPLNIIGELARPISLSFRLFGNILSGLILLTLIYSLAPIFTRFGLPIVLHGFFDLAEGLLQAYIFTILSLSFIGAAASKNEE
jgi:F-type H+-transporting ATPase subunit a